MVIPAKAGIQRAEGQLGLRRFGSPRLLCSGSYAKVCVRGRVPAGLEGLSLALGHVFRRVRRTWE